MLHLPAFLQVKVLRETVLSGTNQLAHMVKVGREDSYQFPPAKIKVTMWRMMVVLIPDGTGVQAQMDLVNKKPLNPGSI